MAYRGRHKEAEGRIKISLWIDGSDWAWLAQHHRGAASQVVRDLVAEYRERVEAPRGRVESLNLEGL